MLTKSIVHASSLVAEELADRGLVIETKRGVGLTKLVTETYNISPGGTWSMEELAENMQLMQRTNAVHRSLQTDLVNGTTSSVRESVSSLRGDVVGAIMDFHESVMEKYSHAHFNDRSAEFTIEKLSMPAPVVTNMDALGLRRFPATVSQSLDSVGLYGSSLEVADLHNFLRTGNSEVDANINKWLLSVNTEAIRSTWDKVFNSRVTSLHLKELYANKPTLETMDTSLLIILGARAMRREVVPTAEGMPNGQYMAFARDLEAYAGTMLSRGFKAYKRTIKNGTFILRGDIDTKTVVVLEETYNDYIDAGGSINSILGGLIGSAKKQTLHDAKEAIFANDNKWKAYVALNATAEKRERLAYLKKVCKYSFADAYKNNQTSLENAYYDGNEPSALPVAQANDRIDKMTYRDMADMHNFSRELVATTRFHFTNANEFLETMTSLRVSNPDVTPDEAALLATVDYVAEHIAAQLTIKSAH